MSTDIYHGTDTYVVYAEDTAWGTAGTPTGSDYIDRITGITCSVRNNRARYNQLGTGPDATAVMNGTVEISGTITAELTNAKFFEYLINGVSVANTGTESDPSDINEVNNIGYTATTCPSLTVEFGNDGVVDDVITLDGVTFQSWRVTGRVGEIVTYSADYRARNINRAATGALTYTAPTEQPFSFADCTVAFGSDTVLKVESFEISGNNNTNLYYSVGSRFLQHPTMGTRRYDWTLTVTHSDDTTASRLSGTELRELLFGAAGSTSPEAGGTPTTCGNVIITLTEGAATGDETIIFQMENCYIDEISEPIEMSDTGGQIMLTVTGFSLAGLTNASDKTFIQYYTHS